MAAPERVGSTDEALLAFSENPGVPESAFSAIDCAVSNGHGGADAPVAVVAQAHEAPPRHATPEPFSVEHTNNPPAGTLHVKHILNTCGQDTKLGGSLWYPMVGERPYGAEWGWQWYEDAAQARKTARVARMAKAAAQATATTPTPLFTAAPAVVPANFV